MTDKFYYRDISDDVVPPGYCMMYNDDTVGFKETLVVHVYEHEEDADYAVRVANSNEPDPNVHYYVKRKNGYYV